MLKLLSLTVSVFCAQAFASSIIPYIGPVLIKTTHSGFVAPGYNTYTKCEIYNNVMFPSKIVITNGAGSLESEVSKEIKLTGDIAKTIVDAQKGPFIREMAPVDGPGVSYLARKANPNGSYEEIILFSDNGGDGKRVTNKATEAISLRNFIDLNCK